MPDGCALALDWNGTVVDDGPRALRALHVAAGPLAGLPEHLAGFRAGFRLPLRAWFAALGVPEERLEDTERRWNAELAHHPAALALGARELLGWCHERAIEVHVVTGAGAAVVEADAVRHGVRHLLTTIVAGADPKSDALAGWGSDRQVVYVGDTEYDIDEARRAGALPVAVTGGYRPAEALRARRPALVVDDLREVIGVLDGPHEAWARQEDRVITTPGHD